MATEKLKKNQKSERGKNGGVRSGSGRKRGKVSDANQAVLEAKKHFIRRVAKNTDKLFNAQLNKAVGETYLMWEHTIGRGKNGKNVVEIVTDPNTIRDFLDGSIESSGYYYITTKSADNSAIADMLNRGLGRPTEHIEADVTSDGERIQGSISENQLTQLIRARSERSDI